MSEERLQMLKEITEAPGVPGFEHEVREVIKRYLPDGAGYDVTTDNLGSLICRKTGGSGGPRIMLPAHMDEIGFMVKDVTEKGFVKFHPLGGWWDQVLLGQRVVVKTSQGDVPGVIGNKPPHLLSSDEAKKPVEKKDMFIDIGASDKKEARSFGVRPGDPIIPVSPFTKMRNSRVLAAKAWDDRVGCALFVDLLRALNGKPHPNVVYGVGTVQEEVGLRGARTSTRAIEPDICLTLEVAIAGDVPGIKDDESSVKLGKGPVLYLADASLLPHLKLRDFIIDTAEEGGVELQFSSLERGGTDGGQVHIQGRGVPSAVIAVPTRYIHSHTGLIHLDDYEQTLDFLLQLIERLDSQAVEEIRKY